MIVFLKSSNNVAKNTRFSLIQYNIFSYLLFIYFSFLVDNTPIRVYKNAESIGVPFPKNQPMRIYSSLWNADDWATRGGLVKTDWSKAPFTAYYRNFNSQTFSSSQFSNEKWQNQELDANGRRRLRWVQRNFMIYNYCTDFKRFPQGFPPECKRFWVILVGFCVILWCVCGFILLDYSNQNKCIFLVLFCIFFEACSSSCI